jgi:hypothetical protein
MSAAAGPFIVVMTQPRLVKAPPPDVIERPEYHALFPVVVV